MSVLGTFRGLASKLFRGKRVEDEMDEELRAHIQNRADDLAQSGLDRAEAERRARVEFGGYQRVKEECRDTFGAHFLETVYQDLRFGIRMLRKSPGFTTVAVLTLALGIGANTAIFTVINAVMLRMLPVEAPRELVAIGKTSRVHSWSTGTPRTDIFSYPLYKEVRDHNSVFTSVMATSRLDNLRVSIEGSPEKARGRVVTGNYFETLGVTPILGRVFTGEEDQKPGGDPVLVISYDYWQRRFGGDERAVGRNIHVNGFPFTIIGVAPPGFLGEVVGDRLDLWAPMMMEAELMPGRDFLATANASSLLLIGRLRPGVTLEQASSNVNAVVRQALTEGLSAILTTDDRDAMKKNDLTVPVSFGGRGLSSWREAFSSPLLLLMGMVGLVLLVACVNVSNLMLARSAARQREIAVRLAIGAARGRIVSQLLTEAALLAVLGGALGLLLANWGSAELVHLVSGSTSDPLALGLNWQVLLFTGGVCVVACVLFGLAPALDFLKANVGPALKEAGRGTGPSSGRGITGRILVSAQIALGVLVLMAAGLLIRSLRNLQEADLGYGREHLVLARVDGTASGYKGAAEQNLIRQILDALAGLPGVQGVTVSANGLYSGTESEDGIRVEGYVSQEKAEAAHDDSVGPNYFSTIGVPIVQGREINEQDYRANARVLVVNETFAKFYYGERNPLGRKIFVDDSDHPDAPPFEIIGVAKDVKDHGIRAEVPRRMYAPITSGTFDDAGAPNFEIRAAGNPESLVKTVRQRIQGVDANLVIEGVETANYLVENSITSETLVAKLSSFFGGLVLLLVCLGLYGSMSYGVESRTREIGVRVAMGARRWDVIWMVTREACVMLAIGAGLGIPAGVATTILFKSMLFGVGGADPLSIAAAIATLFAISFVAAIVPARRAMRVDPMVALRYE